MPRYVIVSAEIGGDSLGQAGGMAKQPNPPFVAQFTGSLVNPVTLAGTITVFCMSAPITLIRRSDGAASLQD
jgi:hypothetical protein